MGGKNVTIKEINRRLKNIEYKKNINLEWKLLEFKGSRSIIEHICLTCKTRKKSCLKNLENDIGFDCIACGQAKTTLSKLISSETILKRITSIDTEIFKEYGRRSYPKIYLYKGTESIIEHKCLKCNSKKKSNFGNFKNKSGLICKKCSYLDIATNRTYSIDILINELISKHGVQPTFKAYSEYLGRNTLFEFFCATCPEKVTRTFDSLIVGYALCAKCSKKQTATKLALSPVQINSILGAEDCVWIDGIYENNRSPLTIRCKCGSNYVCALAEFQDGQTKCSACSKAKSLGETLMEEVIYFYTKKFNLTYKFQQTFDDLKSSKDKFLRFDFSIFDKEKLLYLLEHNGSQHYEFTPCFHENEQAFLELQKNDIQKVDYCIDKKYTLLTTTYLDLNNFHEILMAKLNFSPESKAEFYASLKDIRKELWKEQIILAYTIYGEYIDSYRTVSEAATLLSKHSIKITHGDISSCLQEKRRSVKNIIFIKQKNLNLLPDLLNHYKNLKPHLFNHIKVTSLDKKFNKIMSMDEAKLFFNLPRSSQITQTCKKNSSSISKQYTVKGYVCEFVPFIKSKEELLF